jgi:hypothetical protein
MRLLLIFALISAGMMIAPAQTAKTFTVSPVESRCPEYGTLLKSYVLLTDDYLIRFCDLDNWVSRLDAARQTVTFQSPDTLTFITLKLTEKDKAAVTNRVATNQLGNANADGAAAPVSEAAKRLQQMVPAASIKLETDCFAAGVKGQAVDFEAVSNRGRMQGRLAWLDFPACELVVTVSTIGDFKQAHVPITRLLNSLQLEKAPAKPPGT